MAGVCERCWSRACSEALSRGVPVVDVYGRLLGEDDCTPEQQAGPDALACEACGRKAVHPAIKTCRACGTAKPYD